MTNHSMTETGLDKCGTWKAGDMVTADDALVSCPVCKHFEEIQQGWEEYVSQPTNFGEDNAQIQMAERDAYFAAAARFLSMAVPF